MAIAIKATYEYGGFVFSFWSSSLTERLANNDDFSSDWSSEQQYPPPLLVASRGGTVVGPVAAAV